MSREFYGDALKTQVRSIIRKDSSLSTNPNGLILAVWQLNGLKVKRRQRQQLFLLPEAGDIFDALIKLANESEEAKKIKTTAKKGDVNGMSYEAVPSEPKPHKIKVTAGRSSGKHK